MGSLEKDGPVTLKTAECFIDVNAKRLQQVLYPLLSEDHLCFCFAGDEQTLRIDDINTISMN